MLTLKAANSGGYRAYWDGWFCIGDIYREPKSRNEWVWWPTEGGFIWASMLHAVAAKLDELNAAGEARLTTDPIAGRDYIPSQDTSAPF